MVVEGEGEREGGGMLTGDQRLRDWCLFIGPRKQVGASLTAQGQRSCYSGETLTNRASVTALRAICVS